MTDLVVDNSIVMKWFFPEIHDDFAARLLTGSPTFHAPELIVPEFTNAVWNQIHSGKIDWWRADEVIFEFSRTPITLHSQLDDAAEAFRLAVQYDHAAYDCFYLALALRLDCQLVTADRKFYDVTIAAYPNNLLWVEDIPAA